MTTRHSIAADCLAAARASVASAPELHTFRRVDGVRVFDAAVEELILRHAVQACINVHAEHEAVRSGE